MTEPGLDLHEWESVWASVEEDLDSDPAAALSQLADLVRRILVERNYQLEDPIAAAGAEPEFVVTYRAVRETTERAELGEASRAEVGTAIDDLRAIFETVTAERP